MNQVITQHGWGLDQSFWDNYKIEFQKNGWHWQDNERGYFSKNVNQSKWVKNNFNDQIKMVLCHSLGFHLIQGNLLDDASHIVFINFDCLTFFEKYPLSLSCQCHPFF